MIGSGETVTRLRGTLTTDRYQNEVVDWSDPDELVIEHAAVAPTRTAEDNVGRTAVISGVTLYLPPGADVLAGDRMRVRGDVWEVDGKPADWRHPLNGAVGLEVQLQDVTG